MTFRCRLNPDGSWSYHHEYIYDWTSEESPRRMCKRCGSIDSLKGDKSPVSRRHTLEGEVDTTTELVSGKSSGFIGGMQ